MAKKTVDFYQFREMVEEYLEVIVSSYEEEDAAERIINSSKKINLIASKVKRGVNFKLAVRQVLQAEIDKIEDEYMRMEQKASFARNKRYDSYSNGDYDNYTSYYFNHF